MGKTSLSEVQNRRTSEICHHMQTQVPEAPFEARRLWRQALKRKGSSTFSGSEPRRELFAR
eukprot:13954257-Alexandrium_andersonii.AAC.1